MTLAVDAEADAVARIPAVTLVRILVALLDNAVQHSPSGGSVTVRIGRAARDVTVRVIDDGDRIEGIPPDQIFERFARPPRAVDPRGFGLGLSLVRDVARRAGRLDRGRALELDGTTFLLTLPAIR